MPLLEPASDDAPDSREVCNAEDDALKECPARLMDGFVVPSRIEEAMADEILTEYAENAQRSGEPVNLKVITGFLGGVKEESKLQVLDGSV